MIHPQRVRRLNDRPAQRGRYVLYWMQQSQRGRCNHALQYAIERADELSLPLLACFGLTDAYPHANLRHYAFMVQGLLEARAELRERGIRLLLLRGAPPEVAAGLADQAALVVVDAGYTRAQRQWRARAAGLIRAPLLQVEADVVVPTAAASDKHEFAARTLRPKIERLLAEHLEPLPERDPRRSSLGLDIAADELPDDERAILDGLAIDRRVRPAAETIGGASQALRRLNAFVEQGLERYAELRHDPNFNATSRLSPYLHFGQIAALEVALAVRAADTAGAAAFLEELIVRRELAINHALHHPDYDRYAGLPEWARKTLERHATDRREHEYTAAQWERGRTHDPYFNAAQRQLVCTGWMHGQMRMYWGKKILEWTADPRRAFTIAARLNDKYQLDGRDPNGYAGVAWCFGLHDRPWTERPVLGTLRYMNDRGLRRKFDADAYVRLVGGSCEE